MCLRQFFTHQQGVKDREQALGINNNNNIIILLKILKQMLKNSCILFEIFFCNLFFLENLLAMIETKFNDFMKAKNRKTELQQWLTVKEANSIETSDEEEKQEEENKIDDEENDEENETSKGDNKSNQEDKELKKKRKKADFVIKKKNIKKRKVEPKFEARSKNKFGSRDRKQYDLFILSYFCYFYFIVLQFF